MRRSGPDERTRQAQEEARREFLESVDDLRPRLHRYCSRMLGSPLDGEDAVQETLATTYFKMPLLREPRDLESWMFRVAHNHCIDELRRRRGREVELRKETVGRSAEPTSRPRDPVVREQEVGRAFGRLVGLLPAKERACLILKDVLDFSLREVAEIVESTEGGVKAALHRGRGKLRAATALEANAETPPRPPLDDGRRRLLERYAEHFNARNWTDLVGLLRSDARLEVLEVYEGQGHGAFTDRYFFNYSRFDFEWRFSVEAMGDQWQLVVRRRSESGDGWELFSVVRVSVEEGAVVRVRDYLHVPKYLADELANARRDD